MVMDSVPKLILIRIQNKNDYEAALYFMRRDSRSDKYFYTSSNDRGIYVSDSIIKLLLDIGIPFTYIKGVTGT